MELPARILSIRKSMGLSQEKFGELVNMSQRSVAAWESGDRTPSFSTLSELADKLNITVDFLLGRDEDKTKIKQPAIQDSELRDHIISRIQELPDPALSRLSDFLEGLQAGQEIFSPSPADPDPSDEPRQ